MTSVEKSGKTVDDAVREALKELGVSRADVDVEVLDEGSKGFLGILGARPARVRVTVVRREEPAQEVAESKIEKAQEFLKKLLEHMGVEAEIAREQDASGFVYLRMSGRRMGVVIGRRGQTLDAIQYLVNLVANRDGGPRVRFVLDAEGYREKRAEALRGLAHRMAERAKKQGRRASLEPMSALERRVVHMALADVEGVETYSEGEEPYRRVVIVPKR